MVEFNVDELTLTLKPTSAYKADYIKNFGVLDWVDIAEKIIAVFSYKADLIGIYGEVFPEVKPPQGYTVAYTYGQHSFYFAVAYHTYHMNMNICVKFSAKAWNFFRQATGIEAYSFLQKVQDPCYTTRLSRIDLVADLIDEDINVTTIYQCLMDNTVGIFREKINEDGDSIYIKCPLKYRGVLIHNEVPTLYIGSEKSNSRLRVYDKKREQIEKRGTHFAKYQKVKNAVRFEGVFRNEYSHQLTDELLKIKSDDEFANLIACTLAQKYRFMYIDTKTGKADYNTEYTELILDCITNNNFALMSPSARNYELAKSILYIFQGSGAMNTLYRIKEIWDIDAAEKLLDYILESIEEWQPNDDCRYWLIKNLKDYQNNYPKFDDFMKENLGSAMK